MATDIVGVIGYGDGSPAERRSGYVGQIGIGGQASSGVGEVSEPVYESVIDLSLG